MADAKQVPWLTAADILEQGDQDRVRLAKLVYVEDGAIVLNVAYAYEIELSRCATHTAVLGWVLHLAGKNWVTTEVIRRFMELAVQHNRLEYPQTG